MGDICCPSCGVQLYAADMFPFDGTDVEYRCACGAGLAVHRDIVITYSVTVEREDLSDDC
mgnify:CR=1 FL=1